MRSNGKSAKEYNDMLQGIHKLIDKIPKWQPIETAPKDGTKFLAFEDGDYYGCSFNWEDDEEGTIYWNTYCGQPACYTPEPTHWMPLPEGPEGE